MGIFSKINWLLLYSKNNVEVYANADNLYEDFNVKINDEWIQRFQGESAHSNCEKMLHEIGKEHLNFDIAEILANAQLNYITNLGSDSNDDT